MVPDQAEVDKLFKREVDALFAYVFVKEASELGFAQALRVHIEGLADTAGRRIDRGGVEEETGAGAAVIPDGQGGLKMADVDFRAGVEGSIDCAEAQDVGFGAAGGGSVYVGAALTQGGITIVPQLLRSFAAAEDEAGLNVNPFESLP